MRHVKIIRRVAAGAAVALAGSGLAASSAGAATICVNRVANACTQFQPVAGSIGDQLQAAIVVAGGTAADDTLILGAGTYVRPGGFDYSNGQGKLFVQGNSIADTVLKNSSFGAGEETVLGAGNSAAVTLRDMTIEAPNAASAYAVNFVGNGSRVTNAHIRATPGSPQVTEGVHGSNFTVEDSVIDGGIGNGVFATGGNTLGVYDSTIDAGGQGIYSSAGVTTVKRAHVTSRGGNSAAFINVGGIASVQNSVLVGTDPFNGKAIQSQCDNPDSSTTSLVHVTLKSPAAVGVGVYCPTGGLSDSLSITKSVVAPGTVVDTPGGGAGTEVLNISESRWDGPTPGVTVGPGMRTDDPQFVSATDFRLAPSSPLIDLTPISGNPTSDPNLGDIVNAPRVADGNGDGVAASDLGAYELQPPVIAVPADNLLVNAGAESGTPVFDQTSSPLPTDWTRTAGALTQAYYGSSLFPLLNVGVANGAGTVLFVGGPNAALSTAEQTASLAAKAAEIDAGRVTASLTGLLGGKAGEDDRASVTAVFLNAGGTPIGSLLTIGPTTPTARGGGVILLRRSASLVVPAGARSVRTTMRAERGASGNSYNDATFDNLALTTTTAALPTPPTTGGGTTGGGTTGGGTAGGGPLPTKPPAYRGLRLSAAKLRLDTRGRVTTKVSCYAASVSRCAGTVDVYRRVRKGKRLVTKVLGRARVIVKAGKSASVRIRVTLSRKDRKSVRRSGLKVTLRSVTKDSRPKGTSKTTRKSVKLIPARKARKAKRP